MNLVWIKFVDDEKLTQCLNSTEHDVGLARGEHGVEVQVDSQRLRNCHALSLVGGYGMGEVVEWVGRPLKDEIPSYRLELEDVSKAEDGHTAKRLVVLLHLLKSEVQHVEHITLDKGYLIDDYHHKFCKLSFSPVSVPVVHAEELVAIAKLEGAGQGQSADVGGRSSCEGRLEDIGLFRRVSLLLEYGLHPFGQGVNHR